VTSYIYNFFKVLNLIISGTKLTRPFSIELKGKLRVGKNVSIGRNVSFSGKVLLGDNVVIEEGCILSSCSVSDSVLIKSNSIIEDSIISKETFIGPYARVRSKVFIGESCQIGNFVEIKNSNINSGCRLNHMAFIGDSDLEKDVTIGAGVITCNHDGKNIQRTVIGQGAYIGSNSNLIAPIKIGANATIGSGSTITKDVVPNELTLARTKQITVSNWKRKT